MKTITFTIENGEVKLDASGFKGGACEVAAKAFEEILGGNVNGKKLKSDFYEKPNTEVVRVGGAR